MKKSERLNQMLKFINQKKRFTLRDLMSEFSISKRTALRDITSLEELGAPIYAEYGRNGGYTLINQMQLPPISFNSQEVYALYLSLQILQSVSDIPFKATYESIHRKFMDALTEAQKEQIQRMKHRVGFYVTEQLAECPYLEMIITAIIENNVLDIDYRGKSRLIQPITVYMMKGFWYCQSMDLEQQSYRVFRCDRIERATLTEIEPIAEFEVSSDMNETIHRLWQPSVHAIRFKCLLDEKGIDYFRMEHYPSMKITVEQGETYLIGTYEPNELEFICQYLSRFGKSIKVLEPEQLKQSLRSYYNHLILNLNQIS